MPRNPKDHAVFVYAPTRRRAEDWRCAEAPNARVLFVSELRHVLGQEAGWFVVDFSGSAIEPDPRIIAELRSKDGWLRYHRETAERFPAVGSLAKKDHIKYVTLVARTQAFWKDFDLMADASKSPRKPPIPPSVTPPTLNLVTLPRQDYDKLQHEAQIGRQFLEQMQVMAEMEAQARVAADIAGKTVNEWFSEHWGDIAEFKLTVDESGNWRDGKIKTTNGVIIKLPAPRKLSVERTILNKPVGLPGPLGSL